jgi:serine protease Do
VISRNQHQSARVAVARRQQAWGLSIAILVFLALMALAARPVLAAPVPESFADLAEKVAPAVVNISTTQTVHSSRGMFPELPPGSPFEEFFKDFLERRGGGQDEDQERQAQSLGSGFIIDKTGIVVTNNHVVDGADEIVVKLSNGDEYEATLLGKDKLTDLAVLKIESDKDLPYVEFGDSDAARVGDWVMAIGNPYGLGGSVTVGIVSARSRQIQMGPYDDFIQTDAAINRGNSGGPLITMAGKVVGINSAIFSPTGGSVGIGFSIPSNQASPIVADLRNSGKVTRGWLGVSLQPMTDETAESLGLDETQGALIANVVDGDPAQKGGIKAGDVILSFDGEDIDDESVLTRVVAATEIGKPVKVVVWRNGKKKTLSVELVQRKDEELLAQDGSLNKEPAKAEEETVAGMELSALTDDTRGTFNIPDDVNGVLITDIERGSDAAKKGLRPGMVIVQVGQEAEENALTPVSLKAKITDMQEKEQKFVLLRVYVQDRYLWVPVQLSDD